MQESRDYPLSSITDENLGTHNNVEDQIKSCDMGLPPTLPYQVLQMSQDRMLEDGYNTDVQLGPFYEDEVSEGALFQWMKKLPRPQH